jgi:hypothetical protein
LRQRTLALHGGDVRLELLLPSGVDCFVAAVTQLERTPHHEVHRLCCRELALEEWRIVDIADLDRAVSGIHTLAAVPIALPVASRMASNTGSVPATRFSSQAR